MRIVFSWDDGAPEDLRLIELHEKYGIPGMFFVPTRNLEGRDVLTPEQIRNARSGLISFGGHTENHVYLTAIEPDRVESEIVNNKRYLEDVLGEEIRHFCLPGGQYNQDILSTAFRHFTTVRTADTFNFKDGSTINKNGQRLLMPTFHFYPRTYKSRIGNCLKHQSFGQLGYIAAHPWWTYLKLIQETLERERNKSSVIMIWGHSWEIEKLGHWSDLETLMGRIASDFRGNCVDYSMLDTTVT